MNNYAIAKVVNRMPALFRVEEQDEFPSDLFDAVIKRIGTLSDSQVEGGGLVVDYQPKGEPKLRRLVLAFSELGMWVEYSGYLSEQSSQA